MLASTAAPAARRGPPLALRRTVRAASASSVASVAEAIKGLNSALPWPAIASAAEATASAVGYAVPAGLPSVKTMDRVFDKEASATGRAPRVTLYRDAAAWCPYCHKVLLYLEERRIDYNVVLENMRCYGGKSPAFLAIVPSGLLPVLVLDGNRVITESEDIVKLLDATFPTSQSHRSMGEADVPASEASGSGTGVAATLRGLMLGGGRETKWRGGGDSASSGAQPPSAKAKAARMTSLLRLERRVFSAWLQWLTSGMSHSSRQANFEAVLDEVCSELGDGPFFGGAQPCYGDVALAPFLERAVATVGYYKGLVVRGTGRWPAIDRWFESWEARDSYRCLKGDFYSHVHDMPPQVGQCVKHDSEAARAIRRAVDGFEGMGVDGVADSDNAHGALVGAGLESLCYRWDPSSVLGGGFVASRLEAALRLSENHEAVVRFSLRGLPQTVSMGGVSSPLCDPSADVRAVSEVDVEKADKAMRRACVGMLLDVGARVGVDAVDEGEGAVDDGGVGAAARAYLRDRVCVPRDLSLPGAAALRRAMS